MIESGTTVTLKEWAWCHDEAFKKAVLRYHHNPSLKSLRNISPHNFFFFCLGETNV